MSIGSVLIGIAMLLLALPFVINPLIKGNQNNPPGEAPKEASLSGDRHTGFLLALRDLEFDHQVGKITDDDYTNLRATLMLQAAAALEYQDKLDAELDTRLEQAIQLRRANQSKSQVCSHCGSALEPSDRFCRACGQPVESTCPKCGGKLYPTDTFCNRCGARLLRINENPQTEGSL